jgi:hypothetical protein
MKHRHIIPVEKLDAENVFYWHWICRKCKGENKDSNDQQKDAKDRTEASGLNSHTENRVDMTRQIEGENQLDNLLPSLTEYCDYICQ